MSNETNKNEYNGWTNYETWNCKLWIDNDSEATEYSDRMQVAKYSLMNRLKDEFNENQPELAGCYQDLLNAAISEINFYEIAESILAEIDTTDDFNDEFRCERCGNISDIENSIRLDNDDLICANCD